MATTSGEQSIQTPANRQTWLIIFAALVGAVFIYGLLCYFITQSRVANPQNVLPLPKPAFKMALSLVAVMTLLGSIGWMHWKTSGKIGDGSTYGVAKVELMTPADFQTQSIIALAFAEACSIYGLVIFFNGASIKEFVPFAVGTLLVDFLYILPRGLKYWLSWEQQQKAKEQSANSSFSQSL